MQFVRKIINSDKIEKGIKVPKELRHKKVELFIFPIEEQKKPVATKFDPDTFAGSLKLNNPDKEIAMLRREWDRR